MQEEFCIQQKKDIEELQKHFDALKKIVESEKQLNKRIKESKSHEENIDIFNMYHHGGEHAAAVGQCELMYTYDKLFGEYNHTVAQLLLTGEDIEDENWIKSFEEGTEYALVSEEPQGAH